MSQTARKWGIGDLLRSATETVMRTGSPVEHEAEVVELQVRQPTYDELSKQIKSLRSKMVQLQTSRAQLEQEIEEAERQIAAAREKNDGERRQVAERIAKLQQQIVTLIANDGIKGEIVENNPPLRREISR